MVQVMPERTTEGVNPASAIIATTNKRVAVDALRLDRIKLPKNLSITPVRIERCIPETTVICEIPDIRIALSDVSDIDPLSPIRTDVISAPSSPSMRRLIASRTACLADIA